MLIYKFDFNNILDKVLYYFNAGDSEKFSKFSCNKLSNHELLVLKNILKNMFNNQYNIYDWRFGSVHEMRIKIIIDNLNNIQYKFNSKLIHLLLTIISTININISYPVKNIILYSFNENLHNYNNDPYIPLNTKKTYDELINEMFDIYGRKDMYDVYANMIYNFYNNFNVLSSFTITILFNTSLIYFKDDNILYINDIAYNYDLINNYIKFDNYVNFNKSIIEYNYYNDFNKLYSFEFKW